MTDGPDPVRKFIDDSLGATLAGLDAAPAGAESRPERSGALDIAIPIFNNPDALRTCLQALLPTLSAGDAVWLLDDGSDDPEVPHVISEFAGRWPATHRATNRVNLGFVATANRAFDLTARDIVLLNSDTQVVPGWLEHLQACLQRNPRAGIVCPLSNRASILSALPDAPSESLVAPIDAVESTTVGDVPLPTAVGFCMLIRRALLEEAGHFDPLFSPGYGEENDFSMRALQLGYDILAADRACVLHRSGGSFDRARSRELQRRHQAKLERLWPEYPPLVQAWWRDNPLRVRSEQLARAGDARDGILHVLHRQYHVGGTERVARTLIGTLEAGYRHTLVYPGDTDNPWCDLELRATAPCRELMLNRRWISPATRIAGHAADFACAQSERALGRLIRGTAARIAHFHHMLHWDSLLLPSLARALGCRVVISVHDFWFNCPVHNQLEYARGQPCGRHHALPDARCMTCLTGYSAAGAAARDFADKAFAYASGRHALIQRVLNEADAILVPSHFIRNKMLQAFDLQESDRLQVHPHGVKLPKTPEPRPAGGQWVLGYFGGDQVLKGAGLVVELARKLVDEPVRILVFGRVKGFDSANLPPNIELRGFYNPDEVGRAMRAIDLALVPSRYEESYSLVVSECWAHGVPVISSDRGALRERVIPGVNGWTVGDFAVESWLEAVRHALDGDVMAQVRERLRQHRVVSIERAAKALDALYRRLLREPADTALPAPAFAADSGFSKTLRALRSREVRKGAPWLPQGRRIRRPAGRAHCLGIVRDHWGTAQYRVRFPLESLAREGACASAAFHVVRQAGFDVRAALQNANANRVLIQPFVADQGLALMEYLARESGLHVTLVVDDLWTALPEDNPVRSMLPPDVLDRLRYATTLAHSLVLTTDELQHRLGLDHPDTHVIDNALPGWIWPPRQQPARQGRRGKPRIGWAGAPQHTGDLAFLAPVMEATADRADWIFLGMCPESLRSLAAEVHPLRPFADYPAGLAAAGLDLAIAPLADHPFNRCKSHLKVLEYGILGLPVIASDLEPYRQCPVLLAKPDDAPDWTGKIDALLDSAGERRSRGEALRAWVCEHHLLRHRLPQWQAALVIDVHAG